MSRQLFFDIIKAALNNEKMPYSEEVDKLEKAFQVQGIAQILYPVFSEEKFKKYYHHAITIDAYMDASINKVLDEFSKNNIRHVILKGFYLKNLYPQTFYRTMGDLDVLVDKKHNKSTNKILKQLGFKEGTRIFHHIDYHKDKVTIEVHFFLLGVSYKAHKHFLNWQDHIKEYKASTYVLEDTYHLLFIIAHFAKHMVNAGAGIRNIMDIYIMFTKRDIDLEFLLDELKQVELYDFFMNVVQMIDIVFGYKICDYPKNEYIDDIILHMLRVPEKGSMINVDIANLSKSGGSRIKLYFRKIFIPLKELFEIYPLSKTIILIPVFYAVHGFKKIFKFKGSKRKESLKHIPEEKLEEQILIQKRMGL